MTAPVHRSAHHWLALAAAGAILLGGCATIRLVADYDETIDSGVSALQHKLSEFFVGLQSAEPADRTFRANQSFYKGAAADLDALQVRAAAVRKNEITSEQLQLVEDNLALIALMHKGCMEGRTISQEQRDAIRSVGADASLNCSVESGASRDIPDRGGQTLNPKVAGVQKGLMEQSLQAILVLEVAKKRGK